MRIVHVTDVYLPALGGIEMHVTDLARRQAERGDDVSVLTFTPMARDCVEHLDPGAEVHVTRLPSLAAAAAVDLTGFDVVHAHVSAVSPLASTLASLASRRGVPTLVTMHSLWSGLGPLPATSAAVFGLRSAPVAWTAVSGVAADVLKRWLPRAAIVEVLPNAGDVGPRAATPVRPPGSPVRLVSTMRLVRLKRPVPLLRMFAQLRRVTTEPVHLTLIGDGKKRRAVDSRVRSYGLAEDVLCTGRLDSPSVLQILETSDVYVAPAPRESFGLAALEARCVGLPVVAIAGSGVGEFVTHGVTGLLAGSDEAMVRMLGRLVDDAPLRHSMAEHNRTTPSQLTWAASMVRTDAAYDRASRLAASTRGRGRSTVTRDGAVKA